MFAIPESFSVQRIVMPERSGLVVVTRDFRSKIKQILDDYGIQYERITSRTKSDKRIAAKARRSPNDWPLLDIHGVRVVCPNEYQQCLASSEIYDYFACDTPRVFPWANISSMRDYRNQEDRAHNLAMSPDYKAIHLSVCLTSGACFGEVQVQTPEDNRVQLETRNQYVRAKAKDIRK